VELLDAACVALNQDSVVEYEGEIKPELRWYERRREGKPEEPEEEPEAATA
jgi:hypothetical protein